MEIKCIAFENVYAEQNWTKILKRGHQKLCLKMKYCILKY